MKKLDLHRKRHSEADRLTENFVLLNELPLEIVTGKSNKMINIVEKVLKKHQFKYYNKWHTNVGSIVVYGNE